MNCQGVTQRKPIYVGDAFGAQNTSDSSGFDSHALDLSDFHYGCPRNLLLTLFKTCQNLCLNVQMPMELIETSWTCSSEVQGSQHPCPRKPLTNVGPDLMDNWEDFCMLTEGPGGFEL